MLSYLIMTETLKIFIIICIWGLGIAILGLSPSSPAYNSQGKAKPHGQVYAL